LMSPALDEPVAFLEIHILKRDNLPGPGFATYDEIAQLIDRKYNGKPHLGKNFRANFGAIAKKFSGAERFERVRREFDPENVFKNEIYDLIRAPSVTPIGFGGQANCALTRDCYCQTDVQCGRGFACAPGLFFSDARTCKLANGSKCHRNDECASN
ncbi:hypothetical protein HK102_012614, partial [Quaeritorhiza haematococci]